MSTLKADAVTAQTTNGNIDITGNGTGKVRLGDGNLIVPDADAAAGQILTTDGSANLTFAATPGTSGNLLTSNGSAWTSAAAAGGGAWTVISTVDLSSGTPSEVTITGINTDYDTYVYVMSAMTFSTDNDGLHMHLGAGGAPGESDAKYAQHQQRLTSTSSTYTGNDGKDNNEWGIGPSVHGNAAGECVVGTIWFYNTGGSQSEYITAIAQTISWMPDTNPATPTFNIKGGVQTMGYGATSFAWDRIRLKCQSGTFLDGRITLYGVAHA